MALSDMCILLITFPKHYYASQRWSSKITENFKKFWTSLPSTLFELGKCIYKGHCNPCTQTQING